MDKGAFVRCGAGVGRFVVGGLVVIVGLTLSCRGPSIDEAGSEGDNKGGSQGENGENGDRAEVREANSPPAQSIPENPAKEPSGIHTPTAAESTALSKINAESSSSRSDPPGPLREAPTKLDLGRSPIRNPLNLYDMGIAGSPNWETAGTVDGAPITMRDLESQSIGVFSRIAQRV